MSYPGGGPIEAGQGPGFTACAAGQSLDTGQGPPQRSSSGVVGDDDRPVGRGLGSRAGFVCGKGNRICALSDPAIEREQQDHDRFLDEMAGT